MTYFINTVIVIAVSIACYSCYQDIKNPVWNSLTSKFSYIPNSSIDKSFDVKMVFFKSMDDIEYDYFNSMYVAKLSDGVDMKATINHYFLRLIFLPWSELEKVGEKRLFIQKRIVYKVRNTNVSIAL